MPTKLSVKGQITIPKKIRDAFKIEPGDIIDFVIEKNEIILKGIKLEQGRLPEIKVPNDTTIKTFQDTDKRKNLVVCKDSEDFFNKLKI